MDPHAMRRPAKLLIWRTGLDSTGLHEACTYDTLEVAIAAAAPFVRDPDAYPWIVTEAGEILTPQWIATHLDADPAPSGRDDGDSAPSPAPAPRSQARKRGWFGLSRPRTRPRPRHNSHRLVFAR